MGWADVVKVKLKACQRPPQLSASHLIAQPPYRTFKFSESRTMVRKFKLLPLLMDSEAPIKDSTWSITTAAFQLVNFPLMNSSIWWQKLERWSLWDMMIDHSIRSSLIFLLLSKCVELSLNLLP